LSVAGGCPFAFPLGGLPPGDLRFFIIFGGANETLVVGESINDGLESLYTRVKLATGESNPVDIPGDMDTFKTDGRSAVWVEPWAPDHGAEVRGVSWLDMDTNALERYLIGGLETEAGRIIHVTAVLDSNVVSLSIQDTANQMRLALFDRTDESLRIIPIEGPETAWLLRDGVLYGFRPALEEDAPAMTQDLVAYDLNADSTRAIFRSEGFYGPGQARGQSSDPIIWSELNASRTLTWRAYDPESDAVRVLHDPAQRELKFYGAGPAGLVLAHSEASALSIQTEYFVVRPDGAQISFASARLGLGVFEPDVSPFLTGNFVAWTDPRTFKIRYRNLDTGQETVYP
jgi:hypothetical protein